MGKSGPFIADGYVKDSSNTERQLWDTTGALYPGGVKMTPGSTLEFTVADTTTAQTLENKTVGTGCVFYTTDSTGAATIPNYGLTRIAASASASTYVLAAPAAGVMKFLHVKANSTNITIDASTAVAIGTVLTTDAYRKIVFSRPATVTLLGITTAQWDVLSVGTTFVGTTALPTFTT
jgi:hypothetical protein